MTRFFLLSLSLLFCSSAFSHDTFEITLEIQVRRNRIDAELEMSRSTAVASTDPQPSNGVLFEPSAFPEWKSKFLEAAPELIQILNTEGEMLIQTLDTRLGREDDVVINYTFERNREDPSALTLAAPILNRFPPDGYGVRVTYRDASGRWHPPFMIFVEQTTVPLPTN